MTAKLFLVLLLAVAANSLPKLTPRLKQEMEAERVSSLLMPGPVLIPNENSVDVEKVYASPECILCQYIMEKLDEKLTQNSTEEEIKDALDKVCSELPSSVSDQCKEFVDKYAELVLKYLSQGLNPQMICTELQLCSGANIIQEYPVELNDGGVKVNDIGGSTECELCETIAKQIESLIILNSTQQELEEALKQVCNILPEDIKAQCNKFIDQYLPEILNLIALEISPEMLCKELGLCTSSKVITIREGQLEAMAPKDSNLTCEFCLEIIGMAKKLVMKNDTMADVEKLLKLVCYYMLPIMKECIDFIDNTIPEIFKELSKMDPEAICKQLKLCASSSAHVGARCFLTDINRCFQP